MTDNANDLSIYLHWPFCRSKCPYCDFFSQVSRHINQDEIIDSYLQQLNDYAALVPNRHIISVFFGGGTPSLIAPQNIARVLNQIDKLWGLPSQTEISLEANPNTQTPSLFADLRSAGINRLSLGVQSLDDKNLKFLGRTHTSAQALTAIASVLKNFDNHSIDLMYALPDQTCKQWQQQLDLACSFGLKHISLYQLTIEENTPFHRRGIRPLDEETAANMYQLTEQVLKPFGYHKYEVSNYAKIGYSSHHNQTYWQGKDYIGIGKTAHGRLRLNNKIFAVTDPMQFEELTSKQRAEELIIMGLRLVDGINKADFTQSCKLSFDAFINQNFKQQNIDAGLLEENADSLKATTAGFLLLDYLIAGLCR